ncbi:MAG: hypothetical protein RMJ67_03060 [Elusimicrobiota bacterium]|nr:hypothetical protein [Endomicrobiia bacterium]MCX7910470.1 hypothetical protein [Endomicrobiia bacterium]MDW8165474.1 hypothetical protein [Elusimicrobiota bacterium]
MEIFIIFSVLFFLLCFLVLVIYSVLTLIQIKKTAKEAELVLQKINKNLENITGIGVEVRKVISSSIPLMISIFAGIGTSLIKFFKSLFFRR